MTLGSDPLLSLEAQRGRIEITHGCVWLTEAGGGQDVFLAAGDRWHLSGRAVLLCAMAQAGLRLVGGVATDRPAVARWWRRRWQAARMQVQLLQVGPVETPPWP